MISSHLALLRWLMMRTLDGIVERYNPGEEVLMSYRYLIGWLVGAWISARFLRRCDKCVGRGWVVREKAHDA